MRQAGPRKGRISAIFAARHSPVRPSRPHRNRIRCLPQRSHRGPPRRRLAPRRRRQAPPRARFRIRRASFRGSAWPDHARQEHPVVAVDRVAGHRRRVDFGEAIYLGYVAPLVAIGVIASLIGHSRSAGAAAGRRGNCAGPRPRGPVVFAVVRRRVPHRLARRRARPEFRRAARFPCRAQSDRLQLHARMGCRSAEPDSDARHSVDHRRLLRPVPALPRLAGAHALPAGQVHRLYARDGAIASSRCGLSSRCSRPAQSPALAWQGSGRWALWATRRSVRATATPRPTCCRISSAASPTPTRPA